MKAARCPPRRRAARLYRLGEEHGEEPGPGADVGDPPSRLHAGRSEYLVPLPVDSRPSFSKPFFSARRRDDEGKAS